MCLSKWREKESMKQKEKEIREREISFWESDEDDVWFLFLFFVLVFKPGFLRLGFWTLGVCITMLESRWCLFTLQIHRRPQNPKEGFESQPLS